MLQGATVFEPFRNLAGGLLRLSPKRPCYLPRLLLGGLPLLSSPSSSPPPPVWVDAVTQVPQGGPEAREEGHTELSGQVSGQGPWQGV